jgi:hypothetical protein
MRELRDDLEVGCGPRLTVPPGVGVGGRPRPPSRGTAFTEFELVSPTACPARPLSLFLLLSYRRLQVKKLLFIVSSKAPAIGSGGSSSSSGLVVAQGRLAPEEGPPQDSERLPQEGGARKGVLTNEWAAVFR